MSDDERVPFPVDEAPEAGVTTDTPSSTGSGPGSGSGADEPPIAPTEAVPAPRKKRSWKSRLLELALWTVVSLAVAGIMIALSETLLPSNF